MRFVSGKRGKFLSLRTAVVVCHSICDRSTNGIKLAGWTSSSCLSAMFLFSLALSNNSGFAIDSAANADLKSVAAFQLTDATGKVTEVAPQTQKQLTVVCFLGTECPLARFYGQRLSKLSNEYAQRNVRFLGVNSNSHDSQKEVTEYCKELHITFPIFKDPGNRLADQFNARYMSEVYLLDETLAVRYQGRVDDQYQPGVTRTSATREDLRSAIDEVLSGKPVSVAKTDVTGCTIGRIKTPDPSAKYTYCKQITRILNQNCVECHRTGEIGPFSLTDYDEVVGWGETMLETIDTGRMPPWNANPEVGHFQNSRVMPEEDKQVLREWVRSGMPYGDKADLPPQPEYTSGWLLEREPDLVLKMRDRPFHIPSDGTVEYQYFVVDPHFDEDRWVSSSQIIPGNRPTVHHSIVFIRPPDGSDVRGVGYLTGYVPGQRNLTMPHGYARKVPAGSKLVFQQHYTPNGTEQDDLTQIGINFIPESEVTHEVFTLIGIDQEFEIPPNTADHPVHVNVGWFPKRANLLAIIPHMHVRGKSFTATCEIGDKSEVLLDVPRYDFNWQHTYVLEKPLPLSSIDKLEFTAHFDNSKKNPANPDPSQFVTWGDQTWEEMAIAFYEVAEPRSPDSEPEPKRNKQKLIVKTGDDKSASESIDDFVNQFLARFDKNHDGIVEQYETPLSFRRFGFNSFDTNRDAKLTRDEIQEAAKQRKR